MTRDSVERLQDIQASIARIRDYAGGSLTEPEIESLLVLDAILMNFVVIGEAVKNVSPGELAKVDHIPWKAYAGLRDMIAHRYFKIQREIIEETIRSDLPTLLAAVENLLGDTPTSP